MCQQQNKWSALDYPKQGYTTRAVVQECSIIYYSNYYILLLLLLLLLLDYTTTCFENVIRTRKGKALIITYQ